MKVLEAQNAILTNYEVYSHLAEQKERYTQAKRKGPPNYETVVREVSQCRSHPLSSLFCMSMPSPRTAEQFTMLPKRKPGTLPAALNSTTTRGGQP